MKNIDELPFPARDLFPLEKYVAIPLGNIATVMAARGCPFPCIYCSTHLMDGSIVRARQPKRVVDEIEEIRNKYKIKTIFFYADNFTLWNDKNIQEFCDELATRKLSIRWLTNSRIDTLPSDQTLKKMARAGCFLMQFGIESGCLKMVEAMKKAPGKNACERYVQSIKPNIQRTKKAGIFTKANVLIGFQGENRKTVEESVKLLKECKIDLQLRVYFPIPNPGAVLGKWPRKRG